MEAFKQNRYFFFVLKIDIKIFVWVSRKGIVTIKKMAAFPVVHQYRHSTVKVSVLQIFLVMATLQFKRELWIYDVTGFSVST